MSEDQRPPDDPEPKRLDSADLEGDPDATREGGEKPDNSSTGKRLGDFELLRELGRGGMGIVYEARQISLKRRVALKVLPPALGMTAQAKQRFEREAQAAAKLHHTNIVPVHAIGEHEGHHFYAMDLIEGQSLDRVLHELVDEGSNPLMEATVTQTMAEVHPRPSTPSQEQAETSLSDTSAGGREWFDTVAKLMAEVADGLHYAHGRGIIHRDIKPANLMLSKEYRLCVTDFGLARMLQEPGMTVSGSFLGTPAYMSPEQIAAGRVNVDHRADIYSLGAVLYEMLALQRPFPGESREQILAAILSKDPRPPRRFNKKIPLDLETICLKALEKDPDRRYATAGELAQDLRQYLQRGLIAARRAGIHRRAWKSIHRHPVATAATIGVIAVALVGAFAQRLWVGRSMETARGLVAAAETDLREGTYRRGLEKIDRALKIAPDMPDAIKTRGRLLFEANTEPRELVQLARAILADNPDDWEAHGWLGSHWLGDVDVDAHVAALERLAPDTADAWYARGMAAASTTERILCLDRALELDPGHAWALLDRAVEKQVLHQTASAIVDAERAIAVRPRSTRGHRFLAGVYLWDLRDIDGALEEYDKAAAIDPDDWMVYEERSWIYQPTNLDDPTKRLEEVDRALELAPRDFRILTQRARALNAMSRFEEALADSRRAVEIEPNDHGVWSPLFWSLWNLQQLDELRGKMNELHALAESWFNARSAAEAWAFLSYYNRLLGQYDEAANAAERMIELVPHNVGGYSHLIDARREQAGEAATAADCDRLQALELSEPNLLNQRAGLLWLVCHRPEAALADFAAAIKLAPQWADAYYQRGQLHQAQLDYGSAVSDFKKAVDLAPQWAAPHLRRAAALVRLGREQEVVAAVDEGMKIKGQGASYYRTFAFPLFWLGRVDEAVEVLDRAIELHPDDATAYFVRAGISCYGNRPCDAIMVDVERGEELGGATTNRRRLAWVHAADLYVSCPGDYDAEWALQLARKEAELRPDSWYSRGLLGLVLYRHGRYEEAREALAGFLEVAAESDSFYGPGLFAMAMTEWKLGRRAEARAYYDRGVANVEATLPRSPLNLRFKGEAAQLLGIQP